MGSPLVIYLKELRALPFLMMGVFGVYASLDLSAIDMGMASYLLLGLVLLSSVFAIYLLVRQGQLDRFHLTVVFFLLLVLAVSLMNGVDWKNWTYYSFCIVLMLFLLNYYRDEPSMLMYGAMAGFSLSVYVGCYHILSHPEMWINDDAKEVSGYLLGGNYNQMGCRLLAALVTNAMCLKLSKWCWLNMVPLLAAVLVVLFIVKSMTALTCILLFVALCCIPSKRLQRWAISSTLVFVILFEVFVCFNGRGLENNELATWFIVDVLGKDITFTNRTGMWDAAIRMIPSSPVWGFGYPDKEWYMSNMSSFAIGPHNAILAVIIHGGIIGLVLYLSMYVMGLNKLLHHSDRTSNAIYAGVTMLSFMMLMEVYPMYIVIYFLALAYHYPDFCPKSRKEDGL